MTRRLAFTLLLLAGCHHAAESPADAGGTRYQVRGVIRALSHVPGEVVIQHEAIPGFMPAMVMPYPLNPPSLKDKLHEGDAVSFELFWDGQTGYIDRIDDLGPYDAGPPAVPEGPHALATLKEGDALPDAALVGSDGKPVQLAQWKGQVVALTFIFTRCPFAQFCPRLTQTFETTQGKLAHAKFPWHLVSVTIDPKNDTPAVMAAYGKTWHADPARWSLLTGEPKTIDALCEQFDVERVQDKGLLKHTMATAVVDPEGRIRKLFTDSSFSAQELAAAMEAAAKPAR